MKTTRRFRQPTPRDVLDTAVVFSLHRFYSAKGSRTARYYLDRGLPIPEDFLPGRAIMQMRPEDRAVLTHLVSEDARAYRPEHYAAWVEEDGVEKYGTWSPDRPRYRREF